MSYFISAPDGVGAFDLDLFREALAQWEGIDIRDVDVPGDVHAMEWTVPLSHGDVFGALDQSGEVVHLDGYLHDCALFALWLRTIVPSNVELLFYDESYSADVALVTLTQESDLVRAFGS